MKVSVSEALFPISFREEDAEKLGALVKSRRSVVLIGMKRVGIGNFLRFFLYHNNIAKTYIKEENHFFIPVDLNDLVEREIFPFWILTLKRINDAVEASKVSKKIKKQIELFFLDSIQTQDLFLTLDYIRKSLKFLANSGIKPTIFFIRFDRMQDAATHEFFANIQSLVDSTHGKLSYVFTSARALDQLSPVFQKSAVSVLAENLYIKPAKPQDIEIIFKTTIKNHSLNLKEEEKGNLLSIVDGYVQYLLYALIALRENQNIPYNKENLFKFLFEDERIALQSEELWESLKPIEKEILIDTLNGRLKKDKLIEADYLINTGYLNSGKKIFSPLFEEYVKAKDSEKKIQPTDLTKKELTLLKFLETNKNQICEREQIIEAVWPEAEELGVSDWAIDRLVARLRNKLKNQKSNYEIITVKTRGYKLVE